MSALPLPPLLEGKALSNPEVALVPHEGRIEGA